MKTKHVPILELCQEFDRLCKEKGIVVPETEFVWVTFDYGFQWQLVSTDNEIDRSGADQVIPAPLVSEQGEWLPAYLMIKGKRYLPKQYQAGKLRFYAYEHTEFTLFIQNGNTEANARQKMLNYLIAEGIITKLWTTTIAKSVYVEVQ